jgi:hypothetical protein
VIDPVSYKKEELQELKSHLSGRGMLYNEDDYMIAPCRFAKSGWKYIKKDSV